MSPDPHNPAVEPTPPAPGWKEQYGPLIVKVAVAFAGILLAALAVRLGVPAPQITVNAPAAEKSAPADGPKVLQGAGEPQVWDAARQGPARRLLAKLIRARIAKQLQKDGFALIGGNPRPLSAAEAERLVANLDDEQLVEGAVVVGGLGDGKILDALTRLIDWIIANKDKIAEIIKFFMSLLVIFADDGGQAQALPHPAADAVAWHDPTPADAGLWLLAT